MLNRHWTNFFNFIVAKCSIHLALVALDNGRKIQ